MAGPVLAQPVPDADRLAALDAWAPGFMVENQIPGALVALASGGEVVVSRAYGLANVELGVAVTDSTVFEIGSISKQFVAVVVLMLVQEGAMGLDDPVQGHLPEIPSEWYGTTVRQLLTHTSGIPDYEAIATYDTYQFRMTPEAIVEIAHSRPMDFSPGTGFTYSNTGYVLLSRIVERIEGAPLEAVLTSRLFAPLGMTQTRMATPEAIIPHRASGYWVDRMGTLINRWATEPSSTLGAGGLLSSARDLALWDEALEGETLLSAASKAEMWTPVRLPGGALPRWRLGGSEARYGFGWMLDRLGGLRAQHHSGQVAGFRAHFARFPDQDAAVIVFTNRYRAKI
ncbi:MAG: serine hydrolase domain-containing protein, partial [Bacteroidota bacterium]